MNANKLILRNHSDFKYWFVRASLNGPYTKWYVIYSSDTEFNPPEKLGYVIALIDEVDEAAQVVLDPQTGSPLQDAELSKSIQDDFKAFQTTRPEYIVGSILNLQEADLKTMKEMYQKLLVGVALIRARNNHVTDLDDVTMRKIGSCLEWLDTTDFYTAPASTIYHNCVPGGLLQHTLEVVNNIIPLLTLPKFKDIRVENAVLTALVHDWCKIGLYEMYTRNVKNETTNTWEKVPSYKHKDSFCPFGHGVSSLFLVQRFFKLNIDDALAIRWHMGEYNCADNERNDLHHANETYPIVQALQFADRLSITKY